MIALLVCLAIVAAFVAGILTARSVIKELRLVAAEILVRIRRLENAIKAKL